MNTVALSNIGAKPQGRILAFGMFLMGGLGLSYEYTFSKLASDLLGNSAQQWAINIGIMMFFMGIGADIQKYISNKNLISKLVISEILLAIIGGLGPLLLLWAFGHWSSHYIMLHYAFISSIGLLIGFEIPLVTRINESFNEELKYNLAKILKMDYIGALAGALIWIFVLPIWFTIIEMAVVLGLVNIIVAIITLITFKEKIKSLTSLISCISIVTIMLLLTFSKAKEWTLLAEQSLYTDQVIFSETSTFQHIVLTKNKFGKLKCYINGHLQFNEEDEFIYHENLVHPVMNLSKKRGNILILGGGDGLALREVLKYTDIHTVTLVDLDPLITTLASNHSDLKKLNLNSMNHAKLNLLFSSAIGEGGKIELTLPSVKKGRQKLSDQTVNISLFNIDAAKFIANTSNKYDIIIIDFPDPNSLELAKLYSKEFYINIKESLSVGGLIVQQSTSPIHAKEAFLCVGRTMNSAGLATIPTHDNVPSFGEWGWWIAGHDEVFSSMGLKNMIENLEALKVPTKYLTEDLIKTSIIFGKNQLDSQEKNITTISQPNVYKHYLSGWQQNF